MFPTQKLYQTVDRTQYETIKQHHIHAMLGGHYASSSNQAKWQALMEQFILLMPAQRDTLEDFCQRRLQLVERDTNIPLAACISYFEQFYFLHTTTNPLYELNDAEKREVGALLLGAMGWCEPGKQERFELALVLYRRDIHWMNSHLSQARYHVLEGLAERYNVAFAIDDVYSTHTIKFMKELAQGRQLGG